MVYLEADLDFVVVAVVVEVAWLCGDSVVVVVVVAVAVVAVDCWLDVAPM